MRFIFICFLLISSVLYSQDNKNHYLPENLDKLKTYLKKINDSHINTIDGRYASKIKKILKDRDETIFESVKDSNFVFNVALQKNLDAILQHIYLSNPEIDHSNFSFFIKNDIIPNAASYGNGMFEINLGLFTLLESDDELTFVICHEIAHKLLDHATKNIERRVEIINSDDTKERVKDLKKKQYGRTRAALSVIDELSISILDYSNEAEAEADSLGFVLFSKTIYNKNQAISSLKKLNFENDVLLNHPVKIDSVFNFESYPFQSYWLKKTTSIFSIDKEINEFKLASDTIKSHPEIDFRITKLKKEFEIDSLSTQKTTIYLEEIKNIAQIASVGFTIDLKNLDFSIYQLIEKYNRKLISSEYYYTTMAGVLKEIYVAKKGHDLGKYVPHANNLSKEKELNSIRLFLHNLELNEVKKIGLAFCDSNKDKVNNNEVFKQSHNFFKNN